MTLEGAVVGGTTISRYRRFENLAARSVETTTRKDNWWIEPLLFLLVFGAFVLYTTWRVFENNWYAYPWAAPYPNNHALTKRSRPLPTCCRSTRRSCAIFLNVFGFNLSPAMYILIFPLSFRMTCYYYRKAYYRAIFGDSAGCAVAEPFPNKRMRFTGERHFPWALQNFHRFGFSTPRSYSR